MKSLSIKKGHLKSKVQVPSSKSYANRALILTAILEKSPALHNLPHATDVTNLLNCFRKIGLIIQMDQETLKITNSFPACENSGHELEVGDGGTTARFLGAMLLLGKEAYTLKLGKRLKDRPWNEFLEIVHSLGGKAELSGDRLKLQGPIKLPPTLEIDCSKTTQFATAFQLISFGKSVKIIPQNLRSSISYWQMTEKLLLDITSNNDYSIPLDWSSASYPLAFAALNQKIEFPGLKKDNYQADSKFLTILEKYNFVSYSADGSVIVTPVKASGALVFDMSDALDLVPALSFFLAHIPGKHQLSGIENLVHKESDRLNEVIKLLKIFEKESSTDGYSLFIEGNELRIDRPVNLEIADDHRMVMAGTLFLLHHGGGTIKPYEAVEKSYPEFFDLIISS